MFLSGKQKEELNKSLAGYFTSKGFAKTAEEFAKDASPGKEESKYKDMMVKKWRSILRLESTIEELQDKKKDLSDQINNYGKGEGKIDMTDALPSSEAHSLEAHRGPITGITFHPKFALVVTCSEDNTIKVWDSDTGDYERDLKGHTDAVQCVAFNVLGTMLASGSTDTNIKLWDFAEEEPTFACIKTLTGHEHTVSSVVFSRDGEMVYSGSRDKTIRVWEVLSGQGKKTIQDKEWVRQVSLSPDETRLASCSMDQVINIWDTKTWTVTWTLFDHDHVIESIAWSNAKADHNIVEHILDEDDQKAARTERLAKEQKATEGGGKYEGGMFLVSGSRDKTIRLWFVNEGVCVKTIRGHDNWVRGVLFHTSGRYILSSSDDKSIRAWDLQKNGRSAMKYDNAHETFVSCIDWCKHKPRMASGDVTNTVKIWDCESV